MNGWIKKKKKASFPVSLFTDIIPVNQVKVKGEGGGRGLFCFWMSRRRLSKQDKFI